MANFEITKHLQLSIHHPEKLCKVSHALSTPLRVGILQQLTGQSLRVNELAKALDQPMSTIALNVRILEEAGLITSELRNGPRGASKLCSRCVDRVDITLFTPIRVPPSTNELIIPLPIGSYSDCQVGRTCGIVGVNSFIGVEDDPRSFYLPERSSAQHLWFRTGYLEYRFPLMLSPGMSLISISCSMELCSEAPYYRNDWPSDITLWMNGHELSTWRSSGDFGGRRGQFCPSWWPDTATQFGLLKTWQVDDKGTYLDGTYTGSLTIDQLGLFDDPFVTLRLGIKPDAECKGGISLFGEKFGDFNQNILITIGYILPGQQRPE